MVGVTVWITELTEGNGIHGNSPGAGEVAKKFL